ncbi:MAG: hypothetical protein WBH40_08385 [Ignavibacteriaceae bacterium]
MIVSKISASPTHFFYCFEAAGGASWKNELDSIEEMRKALKKYGY